MIAEQVEAAAVSTASAPRVRLVSLLLCAIFFLSGMAALAFQNLWFRLAGLAFGNTVWASGIVLASFMGGLALGNWLAAGGLIANIRPVRLYGLLELAIGATGLGLVLGFPTLTNILAPLFGHFLDKPWILNPLRLGIGFALMLVPSTAMGATLPLLVKALNDNGARFGVALGRLYGWNTFGAVVGALLPEAVLIQYVGISGAGYVAAMINVMAALGALLVAWWSGRTASDSPGQCARRFSLVHGSSRLFRLLGAGFLCGGIVLGLEVIWFRTLLLFFSAFGIVFAAMLAVVLAGIALGGMLGSWGLRRGFEPRGNVTGLASVAGLACAGSYLVFGWLPGPTQGSLFPWEHMILVSCCLILPTCLVSGMMFTFIGEAAYQEIGASMQTTGILTMANTLGGMCGALLSAFVFLPVLGMESSLFVFAASYALVAALTVDYSFLKEARQSKIFVWVSACSFALVLAFFPFGAMHRFIVSVGEGILKGETGWKVVKISEGLTETSQYWERRLIGKRTAMTLFTNNHAMSGTRVASQRYMKYFVYLPIALHPGSKDALLICFGVGSTAQAIAETRSFKSIDIVDISTDILTNSKIVFPKPDTNPLNDARVQIHVEDGRFFLATSPRKFDLITAEPPPPLAAGVVNLYSREYFSLIRNRLREGGWVTYWLPVGQIPWSGVKSIVRGFCDVFEDCALWTAQGAEWVLTGVRRPAGSPSEEGFTEQWRDAKVGPEMRKLAFETPELLGSTFLMDATALRKWTSETLPLVDNYPYRIFGTSRPEEEYDYADPESFMDPIAARERFRNSPLIAHLWPRSLRDRTLEYFRIQALMNEAFLHPFRSPSNPDLGLLHEALSCPPLRSPILWLAGGPNMADNECILDSLDPEAVRRTPGLNFHLAVRSMADRNYEKADEYLKAEEEVSDTQNLTLYRAYCLCVAHRTAEASELLRKRQNLPDHSRNGMDKAQLKWLHDKFGLDVRSASR